MIPSQLCRKMLSKQAVFLSTHKEKKKEWRTRKTVKTFYTGLHTNSCILNDSVNLKFIEVSVDICALLIIRRKQKQTNRSDVYERQWKVERKSCR